MEYSFLVIVFICIQIGKRGNDYSKEERTRQHKKITFIFAFMSNLYLFFLYFFILLPPPLQRLLLELLATLLGRSYYYCSRFSCCNLVSFAVFAVFLGLLELLLVLILLVLLLLFFIYCHCYVLTCFLNFPFQYLTHVFTIPNSFLRCQQQCSFLLFFPRFLPYNI